MTHRHPREYLTDDEWAAYNSPSLAFAALCVVILGFVVVGGLAAILWVLSR